MVLAGPVFPEWYWGPIFFVLFFSPVIAAVGALINWRARRIATVRRWATTHVRRYALAVTSLVLAALLIAGALDWWRARAFERENHANAARLPFQPLAPLRKPAGYRTDRVSATEDDVFFSYRSGSRYLWLIERGLGDPTDSNWVRRVATVRGDARLEATYGGGATRAEALALLDTLAPVDAETLDFER